MRRQLLAWWFFWIVAGGGAGIEGPYETESDCERIRKAFQVWAIASSTHPCLPSRPER